MSALRAVHCATLRTGNRGWRMSTPASASATATESATAAAAPSVRAIGDTAVGRCLGCDLLAGQVRPDRRQGCTRGLVGHLRSEGYLEDCSSTGGRASVRHPGLWASRGQCEILNRWCYPRRWGLRKIIQRSRSEEIGDHLCEYQ